MYRPQPTRRTLSKLLRVVEERDSEVVFLKDMTMKTTLRNPDQRPTDPGIVLGWDLLPALGMTRRSDLLRALMPPLPSGHDFSLMAGQNRSHT